jgi:hemerythrin superfamily protein
MMTTSDQIISKGAGLAHELSARLDGLVGVFSALAEQHGEAGALLKRAKADESKRTALWPTIRATLRSHEEGELRELYPVLREYTELRAFADRHATEASLLSQTIDRMDACDPKSPHFADMLDQLIGLVEAHVTEEEKHIFPKSQSVIGDARARALAPKFLATATHAKQTEWTARTD